MTMESDISILGEELLVEILCRLGSVKYATQCKSVCKLWRSLVCTDPYLLRRWDQMNSEKEITTLITHHYDGAIEINCGKKAPIVCVNLDFLSCFSRRNTVRVLGSHKDLLLCWPNDSDRSCYYICNPFTKQWTALPPPPPPPPPSLRQATKHELRRINQRARVEFIVDERADGGLKFTVVRIIPYHVPPLWGLHEGKVQVSVFSSYVGWREMEDVGGWSEMFQAQRSCQKIVSYQGRLVWLMTKEYTDEDRLYGWDLHSNFTPLPLPLPLPRIINANYRFRNKSTIGVCEGRLRIVQMLDDYHKLIVWQLNDSQKQEWDMLSELDFSPFCKNSKSDVTIYTEDIAFHPQDGDILCMHVNMDIVVTGQPKTLESSHICIFNLKRRRREFTRKLWRLKASHAKIFPTVKNCWPTPVPRL